jgi:hypothetical protein
LQIPSFPPMKGNLQIEQLGFMRIKTLHVNYLHKYRTNMCSKSSPSMGDFKGYFYTAP